jgi:IS4 transposase
MTASRSRREPEWEAPTIPEASAALCGMFPPEWVRQTARETGLVKRERVVDPVAMLWVMALSFGVGMVRRIEMLRQRYEQETGDDLGYASFYERFTPELVRFLKACAARGMQELAKDANRTLDDKLKRFVDIFVQDSTVIRVHAALFGKWPATRSRKKKAAGVKVATRISAVANGPADIRIYGERTSESKTMHVGSWVKGCIALFDLGFYKHQMFARIEENGGFFVSRLKANADPLLLASLRTHRGASIDLAGKRWSEVEKKLKREVVDAEVELAFPL